MFIFRQKNIPLNEANEKSLMPSGIVIDVQKIFALLHAKAIVEADKIGAGANPAFEIQNTAAEGNDPKSAVFHSAGEHMILAKAKEQGQKIDKDQAFLAIQKYVEVFLGPDVAKKLTAEDCIPMQAGSEVSESKVFSVSFSQFLAESQIEMLNEAGEDAEEDQVGEQAGEDKEGEDAEEDTEGEDAEEDDSDDEGGDAGEDDSDDEGGDAGDGEDAGDDGEDAGDDGNGEDGEGGDQEDPNKADGFYMLYGLKIAGLKETTVADTLKKWGKDIVDGFAITFGGWGGDDGKVTVKDVKDFTDEVMGVIKKPEEFARKVKDKMEKKFPSVSVGSVNVRDKKTLLADLDRGKRENYDGKARQKISQADYSLMIEVKEKDPDKPFVNRKELASIVTSSLPGGLIAKVKNLITADSIIYLRGAGLKDTNYDYGSRSSDSGNVLSINELRKLLKDNSGKDAVDVIDALEKKFKGIKKNKQIKNTEGRDAIAKLWDEYTAKQDKELEADPSAKIDFTKFESAYAEIYKKFFKKDESMLDTGTRLMGVLFEDFDFRRARTFVEAEDDEDDEEDIMDDGDGSETGEEGEEGEGDESSPYDAQEGDDLYIVPMTNIKFDDDE